MLERLFSGEPWPLVHSEPWERWERSAPLEWDDWNFNAHLGLDEPFSAEESRMLAETRDRDMRRIVLQRRQKIEQDEKDRIRQCLFKSSSESKEKTAQRKQKIAKRKNKAKSRRSRH